MEDAPDTRTILDRAEGDSVNDSRDEPARGGLRILAVADIWQGSNAYAFVRAFRRMGHSVRVLPPGSFVPSAWTRKPLRALRRLIEPVLVDEYREALVAEARRLNPHLFFVFKGRYVHPEAVRAIGGLGAVTVNFYPDVSFRSHGKFIPAALPLYDWIFTTKTFGLEDLRRQLGIEQASFLPHSYDPEVHRPVALDADDREKYACDASFIGTWSPKKEAFLSQLCGALPTRRIRIWGAQWERSGPALAGAVERQEAFGIEYAKALTASKVNLAILSEQRPGSSDGDQITSRTFHIPATGAFMLHERTDEFLEYFREGEECGCFGSAEELIDSVGYYLQRDDERERVAAAGHRRCVESGYSVDHRAATIVEKVGEFRSKK